MTRDEAIEISVQRRYGDVKANRTSNQVKALYINAGKRIDSYVALGMLKLDEPKSAWQTFEDLARSKYDWLPTNDRASILFDISETLAEAGLKIVEK